MTTVCDQLIVHYKQYFAKETMIHGNGERHNYGSKNIISHQDLYFTMDTGETNIIIEHNL